MPVPKRRHSKARRDRGRTHKKMADPINLTTCDNCGSKKMPHRACGDCGYYKGKSYKVVIHK